MATARMMGEPGPWATASVNTIGSLIIGMLAGALAAERLSLSPSTRAFVFVGLLGGFTTFSSYMLDSLTLMEMGLLVTYAGYYVGLRT